MKVYQLNFGRNGQQPTENKDLLKGNLIQEKNMAERPK